MEYERCNIPSIKDESTVEAIARAFCSNGRKKQEALSSVGYADSYALESGRGCEVVFSKVQVKAAIARIDAGTAEKQGRTVESIDEMYQQAFDASIVLRQPSAMVSAVTGIARLYGMDKDGAANTGKDEPKPITDDDRAILAAHAKELSKPRLAKETG